MFNKLILDFHSEVETSIASAASAVHKNWSSLKLTVAVSLWDNAVTYRVVRDGTVIVTTPNSGEALNEYNAWLEKS